MRDKWYGDNRDLVKWATLVELARRFESKHILQVLYYRPNEWAQIEIDGKGTDLPDEVVRHFRSVESACNLKCGVAIDVLKEKFADRHDYLQVVIAAIHARKEGPGLVFLDPDTGLEPESGKFDFSHVCSGELREIWKNLNPGDLLVFYQHEDNKAGREWRRRKKSQFADALRMSGANPDRARLAYAPGIARDVAFFHVRKD